MTVDVANSGPVAGDEVVQLYLQDVLSSVTTYDQVLRGFQRVPLTPGTSVSGADGTADSVAFMIAMRPFAVAKTASALPVDRRRIAAHVTDERCAAADTLPPATASSFTEASETTAGVMD